jgi:hypothetical protein
MIFQPQAGFTLTAPVLDATSYNHIYMGESYGTLRETKK